MRTDHSVNFAQHTQPTVSLINSVSPKRTASTVEQLLQASNRKRKCQLSITTVPKRVLVGCGRLGGMLSTDCLIGCSTLARRIGNAFLLFGLLLTFVLTFLRRTLLWWPFHPAGYALATSRCIDDYWFTIVFASTVKWVILRSGGARGYRRSLPFFLGLIVGDYILACGWSLLGIILDRSMYTVWV